jgi:PQQ-dependent catabolism-associated CXXCW motif protein
MRFQMALVEMMTSFAVCVALAISLITPASAAAPEPPGLWEGQMHGETPGSLAGATVIQTDSLADLRDSIHPILFDVADADKKPVENSNEAPLTAKHLSIRGATWLPGAGSGTADSAFSHDFEKRISALTTSNLDQPIVVFCHPRCWAGWNAAKRLVGLGYRRVFWYPQGVEGWQTMYATEMVEADSEWMSSVRTRNSK